MPKIKIQDIRTGVPSTTTPGVTPHSIASITVPKARPQTVFKGAGSQHLVAGAESLQRGVKGIADILVAHEVRMTKTQASDYLADLQNGLNERYIDNIAPLRSGEAKDIFKNETTLMREGKESFLEKAEDNKYLYNMLSIGYDAVTQKHLQNVLDHKLTQDETYAKDTAFKVGKILQAEMASLGLNESGKAVGISKRIDTQLAEYPIIREAIKIAAWQGMFKFNARINPELTQQLYENDKVKRSIVTAIGFEGYGTIQESIDKGRMIGIQDEKLNRIRVTEQEDKRIESVMQNAIHSIINQPGEFLTRYVDKLNIPTQKKLRLFTFLNSLASGKILTEGEVDYSVYGELLEKVRKTKDLGLNAGEVQDDIIDVMNKDITIDQGEFFLKSLSQRDTIHNPVTEVSYKELEMLNKEGAFDNAVEYIKAVSDLNKIIIKTDGNPKKVQEFMDNILLPPIRKNLVRKALENVGVLRPTAIFQEKASPTAPYMLEQEKDEINYLLRIKGLTVTVDQLNDVDAQNYLNYIRSKEYQQIIRKGK